jgi:hypothetical protein
MATISLILYNLLLFLGLLLLWPFWVGYLLLVPKTRAGFWEKMGHYPQQLREKLSLPPAGKKRL